MSMRDFALIFTALWGVILLLAFLSAPGVLRKSRLLTGKHASFVLIGIALITRLLPNLLLPMGAGYDIGSYRIVGQLVLNRADIYTSQEALKRHPYLPLQMYWMALALRTSEATGLPFVKLVRLAPILADVGITFLLFEGLKRLHGEETAQWGALAFAVNPISVFVSSCHGQFDSLPMLLILLSWYTLRFSTSTPALRVAGAAGWLGLGILDKSWPVLALPSLLREVKGWKRRILFLTCVGIVPAVGVGAYLFLFRASLWPVLVRAVGYNHGVGAWGYTSLLHLLSVLVPRLAAPFHWTGRNGRYVTLAALGLVWLLRARKQPSEEGILTILLAFLALTHAFSIQYLVWIVPFAVLSRQQKWLSRYVLAVLPYYILAYTTLVLDMRINRWMAWPQADWFLIRPSELPAWILSLVWLWRRINGEGCRGASSRK